MQALMNNFTVIIQTMNEKKAMYVKTYPDKVAEVQRRINSRIVVALANTPCKKGQDM